jgi:hypothetical protein
MARLMNVLFIAISMPDMASEQGGYYADLLREMANQGYKLTVVAPAIADGFAGIRNEGRLRIVRVLTGEFIGNFSFFKKGINVWRLSYQYKRAIKKYLSAEEFDVVIMPTPPVTLVDVVAYVKRKYSAKFYLLLRDIHPECLDRKVVPQRFLDRNDVYDECKKPYGVNLIAYWLLYKKAQHLYRISDYIGCMSPGNMNYMKEIAPDVPEGQLVLLPNWYKGKEMDDKDNLIREKYKLENKFIAIFGGTIGEAQAVWNIAQLAKMNLDKKDVVFLVVGRGVRKHVLEEIARKDHLFNMMFLDYMPKEDYEAILQSADLGLISIDEKYKVPTCPSKIIGYMALAKPVLAMFNKGNDYGEFYIDKPGCGLWSVDLDYKKAQENFDWFYLHRAEGKEKGMAGYRYYKQHFTTQAISHLLSEQLASLVE